MHFAALAAGFTIRCYTYIDKDPKSRRIARFVLLVQRQFPFQMPASAILSFDTRLPHIIA